MRIGIFFGGISREREVSFAGGKTASENLDKSLFTPVPVFVDGEGNFILIKPELLYRPEIRDFYPPPAYQSGGFRVYSESLVLNETEQKELISHIGEQIYPHQFRSLFDFAFLALHGPGGEDGSLQGLLEWYGIPYNGPDVQSSGVSMDKIYQNYLIAQTVGLEKRTAIIQKDELATTSISALFERAKAEVGIPFVVKAPHQGSSIGVAFVKQDDIEIFEEALKQCLFIKEVEPKYWQSLSDTEKVALLQKMVNVSEGLGFPVAFGGVIIKHPQTLLEALNQHASQHTSTMVITSVNTEDAVLLEAFVHGQEFSCGVIQTPDGQVVALPPTEIGKPNEDVDFDFDTKYKKNIVRKYIPIRTSLENNQKVQKMVEDCFVALKFGTVTRIDGFLTPEGTVILHDPNTIPGMSPTSLIFKQMAEIGLNVCDAITYFIRQSIRERIRTGKNAVALQVLLNNLDTKIAERVANLFLRQPTEIRFEATNEAYAQAKQTYGKIAASANALPVPILVGENTEQMLPPNLMFKESIADVQALLAGEVHPLIAETRQKAAKVTKQYTGKE